MKKMEKNQTEFFKMSKRIRDDRFSRLEKMIQCVYKFHSLRRKLKKAEKL